MTKSPPNKWCVTRDTEVGTHMYHPYLTKDHAVRLAELMNEMESSRIKSRGGKRHLGDGDFYCAVEHCKVKA